MDIEFLVKRVVTEVTYKVWVAEWAGTDWEDRMVDFDDQRIKITVADNKAGVEIWSTKTGEQLAVIGAPKLIDTPAWLQDLVKRTMELV